MKVVAAEHVAAAASARELPPPGAPEVAFLGRSNVGKSSLLNKLAGRRGLARTSAAPGKTRLLHFYRLECQRGAARRPLVLVDLPGYGWAKVSQAERRSWQALVEGYLSDRLVLRAAVLLQDLRRDVSDDELDLLAWLAERRIPALVALTKCDKLSPGRRAARVRELTRALGLPAERVLATSATRGLGVTELWRAVLAEVD
jgi:GTP-binding protein